MKIPGEIPKITGIYEKQKNMARVDRTNSVNPKNDVVSISGQAKDFQTVYKALKDVPDVRTDKVSELEGKYRAGNYNIDGKDVVDRVIKSIFDKKA